MSIERPTLPDDTTAPVTAELRERIKTAAVQWLVSCPFPLLGISGSTPSQALTESSQALAETWGRELADAVLVALAGDPGDLPARMTEAMRVALVTWSEGTQNEHLAKAALSVRWEHAAHLAARVGDAERRAEHAESEHQVTQDRLTVSERIRAKLKQTIDAFPDARDAANLAHARAELADMEGMVTDLGVVRLQLQEERDALKAAIERVRVAIASFEWTVVGKLVSAALDAPQAREETDRG